MSLGELRSRLALFFNKGLERTPATRLFQVSGIAPKGTDGEIWRQAAGQAMQSAAMLRETAIFAAASRRLNELNATIRCNSLQPSSSFHGLEGSKHKESSIVPKVCEVGIAEPELGIETGAGCTGARRRSHEECLLVPVSPARFFPTPATSPSAKISGTEN